MFCVNCGNEVKEDDKFCKNCGAQVQPNQAASMTFTQNRQKRHKNKTGLLIGTIIAAGAVLLIVLFVLTTVYRNKANETLDKRNQRYENSYTPGADGDYRYYRNYGDHFMGNGAHSCF